MLGMPGGMIFIPLGVPIAVLLFGPVWRDAGEATMALSLFTGAASITSVCTEAFKAAGRPNLLVRAHLAAVIAGGIAMIALLPLGLIGVSTGVSVGALGGATYCLWRVREVIGVSLGDLFTEIWPATLAAAGMAGFIQALERSLDADSHETLVGLAILGVEIVVAAVIYLTLLLALSAGVRSDARALATAIWRRETGRKDPQPTPEAEPVAPVVNAPYDEQAKEPVAVQRRTTASGPAGSTSDGEPLTTVVIPAYNSERLIGATIASVLAQTEPRLEIVVVDDGSTDNTVDVVKEFQGDKRLKLIRQSNKGVAAARNAGIASARTPYVSFLDNDDLWMPLHLERMAAALDADQEAAFANADGWVLDDTSGRVRRAPFSANTTVPNPLPREPSQLLLDLTEENFVYGSVTARRSVLNAVGGFAPEVNGTDDYDLWLRIVAADHLLARPKGRLIVQRIRTDSQGHDWAMMLRQQRKVIARLAANPAADANVHVVAERRLAQIDDLIEFETAEGPLGAVRRARRLAGRLQRRSIRPFTYHRHFPEEVREAFGGRL
jgi:GT2 family glycosyltransferase